MSGHVATAHVTVDTSAERVGQALTDPNLIARYMFGSRVETDWQVGSPIVWKGEYDGRPYEDKGEVLEVEPGRRLTVTHFSPLTGQEDVPENYHRVSYEISEADGGTDLCLTQDDASSEDEAARFSQNWQMMLDGLKGVAEEAPCRASSGRSRSPCVLRRPCRAQRSDVGPASAGIRPA